MDDSTKLPVVKATKVEKGTEENNSRGKPVKATLLEGSERTPIEAYTRKPATSQADKATNWQDKVRNNSSSQDKGGRKL